MWRLNKEKKRRIKENNRLKTTVQVWLCFSFLFTKLFSVVLRFLSYHYLHKSFRRAIFFSTFPLFPHSFEIRHWADFISGLSKSGISFFFIKSKNIVLLYFWFKSSFVFSLIEIHFYSWTPYSLFLSPTSHISRTVKFTCAAINLYESDALACRFYIE